jgi:hypothetical protein
MFVREEGAQQVLGVPFSKPGPLDFQFNSGPPANFEAPNFPSDKTWAPPKTAAPFTDSSAPQKFSRSFIRTPFYSSPLPHPPRAEAPPRGAPPETRGNGSRELGFPRLRKLGFPRLRKLGFPRRRNPTQRFREPGFPHRRNPSLLQSSCCGFRWKRRRAPSRRAPVLFCPEYRTRLPFPEPVIRLFMLRVPFWIRLRTRLRLGCWYWLRQLEPQSPQFQVLSAQWIFELPSCSDMFLLFLVDPSTGVPLSLRVVVTPAPAQNRCARLARVSFKSAYSPPAGPPAGTSGVPGTFLIRSLAVPFTRLFRETHGPHFIIYCIALYFQKFGSPAGI